jgi:heavy metal translocating P-type ATPase
MPASRCWPLPATAPRGREGRPAGAMMLEGPNSEDRLAPVADGQVPPSLVGVPRSHEIVLDIEGMTCASCVTRIERVLHRNESVLEARVNLATRTALIRTSVADPGPLISVVTGAGYGARVHQMASDDGAETKRYLSRLAVSGFFSFYVLLLSLTTPGHSVLVLAVIWLFATPVQFYGGWPFIRGAARGLRHGVHTMDTLIAVGSLAGYGYSVWAVLAGRHDVYFDTSAMIVTLVLMGKVLESTTRAKAGNAARLLLQRAATTARVIRDGREERVEADRLESGDRVLVLPGDKIPADGTVLEGTSAVDLSMLTGESVPVDVRSGDEVFGAALNGHGRLEIQVTRVGADTKLAQIVRLLEETQASKPPIQRLTDRVTAAFVPWILATAFLVFLGWTFFGAAGPGAALLHASAVLLIACPCALGLATPAAVMAGSGRAAEFGVLFKGGETFEASRRIDTLLLDKTGTVTTGRMRLVDVVVEPGEDPRHVLSLAAAAEKGSEHPIARAARGVDVPGGTDFLVHPGAGVEATVGGARIRVGRPDGLPLSLQADAGRMAQSGLTVFGVWKDGRPVGLLGAADGVKDESRATVERMRAFGFDVALVTGDRRAVGDRVAREVGIDRVVAEVFPEGKVAEIRRLQRAGKRVAFVGDGMNDGPALAQADVGIALGTGTDVAIEAADVKIMGGDLGRVMKALFLARWTYSVIAQNLVWAFAYNTLMIPLAGIGALTPFMASAAMAVSSLSVVGNAVRLRRYGSSRFARSQEQEPDPLEGLDQISPADIRRSPWALTWW